MKTSYFIGGSPVSACLLAGILAATGIAVADVDTTGLDETREFSDEGVDYVITYSDTPGDNDRVSTADVDNLEDFSRTSYDRIVDVMGWREPWLSTLPSYQFIVKDDWWYAEPECVVLDAPSIRDWPADDSRVVFFHERFHTVQRNYKDSVNGGGSGYIGSTFGKWVSEGTADAMMDKGYADLDDKVGYPFYEGSAVNFLNSPQESLFDKEYDCCLWWNYCMEQLGANAVEPHYGTEFMRAFWDRIVTNGNTGSANSKLTLEQIMAARGTNLQTVFHNFSICNYTREFDLTGIPNASRYRYIDEITQPITTSVPRTAATMSSSGTTAVGAWSTRYIEASVDETGQCFAAGFRAVSDGDTMAFSVVAVDRENKVIGIKKGIGTEFAGVFISQPGRPIFKICGILAALEEGSSVDWSFDSGTPTLAIERPTFTRPAYPGPFNAPGNIVVTTRVNGLPDLSPPGPNNPSILGLEASYFTVTVGSEPATVLDAAYVGGLWELVVAAPNQAANGLYNLTVDLCPNKGGVTDTEANSVLYGDITFHHAVVLDVSGSMTYPTNAKLDAAKQAAKFYIDAVKDNDRFTVVSFSGDGSECNTDATNLKGAAGMFPGTLANRTAMKNAVQALAPQNLTSIGDGLWIAQDALDNDATPGSIDTILLLTDGKENEARFWDQNPAPGCGRVDTRILADETIVNTRAFGENAETDLCQQIAAQTGGDYLFNPVDEASAASLRAATTDFQELNNQLTLRFFAGLEHSAKLQRIALERGQLGGTQSILIGLNQPNDEVSQSLIYVGWSEATGVKVSIKTPDGLDLAGISKVYKDATHIVFHPNANLIKGDYVVSATEKDGTPVELFAGISGKPGNALDFLCSLSPVKIGGIIGRPEHGRELFEHGMPVDINLAAFDKNGRIRDLVVSVDVTMPNGEKACKNPLPMEDDGASQDGNTNDGRYGIRYTRTPFAASYVFGQGDRDEKSEAPLGSSGNYTVIIRAVGKDNFGNPIDRTFEKSFQIYKRGKLGYGKGDTDGDSLPDSWEIFYGTNPNVPDAGEDPDLDSLKNGDEFLHGTHPSDPDSENGGAADGFEVSHNLCPLDPRDDPFPNLAAVGVITTSDSHGDVSNLKPDALLLHFPDHPNYHRMEIYREKFPNFEPNAGRLVNTIPMAGLVTSTYDEGLSDKQIYFYKFRALSIDGSAATPFSREVSGVARTDPAEPFGSIVINSGQEKTDRLKLAIKLLPRGNAKQYRLSDQPFTSAVPWLALPAIGTIVPFTLTTPPLTHGTLATVYFQFRSDGGLESRTYHSAITLDFNGNNDGDAQPDGTDADDDNDGVSDANELFLHFTNPYAKDTDGDGYRDSEEITAGTDPTAFDSTPDTDNDGFNNKLEILLASNPNNAASIPNIRLDIRVAGGQTEVSFDTVVGVRYRLHSRSDLTNRVRDWPVVNGPSPGNGLRRTVIAPLVEDRNFYSVSFELLPVP